MNRYVTIASWILLFVSLSIRGYWLSQHYYPISTDGFYYLVQFRSIAETGTPFYTRHQNFNFIPPTANPVLWLGALLVKSGFWSPESAFTTLVGFSVLLSTSALLLISSHRRYGWLAPLIAAAFVCSDIAFYRLYAFLKQGISLGWFLLALALFARSSPDIEDQPPWQRIAPYLACGLSAVTHTIGGALSLGLLLVFCGVPPIALYGGLILGGFAVFSTLAPDLRDVLFSVPDLWTKAFTPSVLTMCEFAKCSAFEWAELAIIFAAVVALWLCRSFGHSRVGYFVLFGILFANVPIWGTESHLNLRLGITALWGAWALFGIGIREEQNDTKTNRTVPVVAATASLVIAASCLPHKSYMRQGVKPELLQTHAGTLALWIVDNATIIAPHGSQFRVTYFLRRNARSSLPEGARSQNLYGLSYGPKDRSSDCIEAPDKFISVASSIRCIKIGEGWVIRKLAN